MDYKILIEKIASDTYLDAEDKAVDKINDAYNKFQGRNPKLLATAMTLGALGMAPISAMAFKSDPSKIRALKTIGGTLSGSAAGMTIYDVLNKNMNGSKKAGLNRVNNILKNEYGADPVTSMKSARRLVADLAEEKYLNKQASYNKKYNAEDSRDQGKAMIGAGMMGAGGVTAIDQFHKGNLTGRATLYHNAEKQNVKSIKDKGLLASFAEDPNNLTNRVVTDVPMDKKKGLVYASRTRSGANGAGMARSRLRLVENGDLNVFRMQFDPQGSMQKVRDHFKKNSETLKISVPDKLLNQVENPELRGSKSLKEFMSKINVATPQDRVDAASLYRDMKKNHVVHKGNISPEFIKGSSKYKKLNMKEVADFVKNNPKRFAKGVGLTGAGLGLAGLGAGLAGKSIMDIRQREKNRQKRRK